jgi:hypothetical protein
MYFRRMHSEPLLFYSIDLFFPSLMISMMVNKAILKMASPMVTDPREIRVLSPPSPNGRGFVPEEADRSVYTDQYIDNRTPVCKRFVQVQACHRFREPVIFPHRCLPPSISRTVSTIFITAGSCVMMIIVRPLNFVFIGS